MLRDHRIDQGSALGSDSEVSGKIEMGRINSKRFLDSVMFWPRGAHRREQGRAPFGL